MYALLFLSFIVKVSSIALESRCLDNVHTVPNFNLSGIGRGDWYEVARYPYPGPKTFKCMDFTSTMEGDVYVAVTTNVDRSSPYFIQINAKNVTDTDGSDRLAFTMLSGDSRVLQVLPVAHVLTVDYDKYFIPYACYHDEVKNEVQELAWVLSRTKPTPGKSKEEFMKIVREARIIDEDKLIWFNHPTCSSDA